MTTEEQTVARATQGARISRRCAAFRRRLARQLVRRAYVVGVLLSRLVSCPPGVQRANPTEVRVVGRIRTGSLRGRSSALGPLELRRREVGGRGIPALHVALEVHAAPSRSHHDGRPRRRQGRKAKLWCPSRVSTPDDPRGPRAFEARASAISPDGQVQRSYAWPSAAVAVRPAVSSVLRPAAVSIRLAPSEGFEPPTLWRIFHLSGTTTVGSKSG